MGKKRVVFFDEFSKVAIIATFAYALFNGVMYWIAVMAGKSPADTVVHDSMEMVLVPLLGYFTRTVFLKHSLNKYGLTLEDSGKTTKIKTP